MTNILHNQKYDAEILVVCDPVTRDNITEKLPMKKKHLAHFAKTADENGFKSADFGFINCAPKIPLEIESSKTKVAHFIKEHQQEFLHTCAKYDKKKLILTMGSLAPIQFANKQVQITKVRGQATVYDTVPTPVFHTYAMGYVQAHPGNQMVFEADFKRLASLRDSDYSLKSVILDADLDYQWCTDLTEWIENPPISMAYDTEGTGLEWFKPEIYPFTIQFCRKEGSAVIVPIDKDYYPELDRDHDLILHQVQQIMGNEKIRKAGHNIKYDNHMLREIGINVKGPFIDTQQLVFNIDENIKNKSLDECIRLFVSELSGYADAFNKRVDKSKMIEVPYDELKTYGCGDADAVYRLAKTLMPQLKKNPKQYFLFQNVQMPGIMAFADTLEYYGVPIDECQLRALGERLDAEEKELYSKLISEVPGKVKRKHLEDPKHNKKAPEKILAFTRPDLVRDTLFTRDGFNLKPKVFTKGTKRLPDDQKVPSTSGKHHLTHFKEFKTKSGFKFVENFMTYQKLQKMQGTYVGQEGEEETGDGVSGFWKYIHNGIIRPSYFLSSTVTGRSSSRSPNGQNFNKRGPWAKDFLKLFVAPPGYKLISADYSQAELRIAAWEAKEPRMLEAYKNGEDIHAVTGAYLSGLTMDQFNALPESEIDLIRFKAKGCIAEGQLVLTNFGLIPIEKITQQMLVWDGYEYVKHGGLIDKGIQEVIEYQGLIATPDHRVLLENGRWVQLKDAKSRSEKISKGAKGEKPLRVMDSISRDAQENKRLLAYSMPVFSYKTGTMDIEKQFSVWKNKRKSSSQKAGKSSFITRGEVRCVKTALRESEKRVLSKLWRQGDNEQIYSTRFYKLGNGKFTAQRLQGTGNRQNKQRRALSAGEFETSNKNTEFTKQTHQQMDKLQKYKSINKSCVASYKNRLSKFSIFKKENCNTTSRRFYSRPNIKYEKKSRWKRVYDIADCGPKNRFTVSGLIVHNCNFGLLYGSMAKTYMEYTYTSYGVILTLNEAEQHREAFFDLYKGLQPWAEKKLAYVHKHGYIDSLHGARRHLPDINSSDEWIVREAERQAVNSSVQRFGSDLGVIASTRLARDLKLANKVSIEIPIEIRMFIHDALVFMVPDYYVECALPAIKWYMENNPLTQWFGLNSPVPIVADIEVGQNLGQLQKRKDVIAQKPDWFTSDLLIS